MTDYQKFLTNTPKLIKFRQLLTNSDFKHDRCALVSQFRYQLELNNQSMQPKQFKSNEIVIQIQARLISVPQFNR